MLILAMLVRFARGLWHLHSLQWARILARFGADPRRFFAIGSDNLLRMKTADVTLSVSHAWALRSIEILERVVRAGGRIELAEHSQFLLELSGCRLLVETNQDFHIVKEIFLDGAYNFSLRRPCIVLDVGMNVGMASLFFATKHEVQKVIGYEPFGETFQQALRNFANNVHISPKIDARNFGVGYPPRELEVEYDYALKGSIGINGIETEAATALGQRSAPPKIAKIVIQDFAQHLAEACGAWADHPLVIKLDCEGCEYEIIERLEAQGLLGRVTLFMIEWHKRGPARIAEILTKNGFAVLSLRPHSNYVGMLYAVRTAS